jgi:hypothetical protein
MPLTNEFVKSLKSLPDLEHYQDSEELCLYVFPSGKKIWAGTGEFGPIFLGSYPKVQLDEARARSGMLSKFLALGLLPESSKATLHETFSEMANNDGHNPLFLFKAKKRKPRKMGHRSNNQQEHHDYGGPASPGLSGNDSSPSTGNTEDSRLAPNQLI